MKKPTSKAFEVMANVIKEATPANKPDIANPYQTALPGAKWTPKKNPARKTRAKAKEEAEKAKAEKEKAEKEKQDKAKAKDREVSQQAIIEATVPKVRPHPASNAAILTVCGNF